MNLKQCTGPNNCQAMVPVVKERISMGGLRLKNPRALCPDCVRLAKLYINAAQRVAYKAGKDSVCTGKIGIL